MLVITDLACAKYTTTICTFERAHARAKNAANCIFFMGSDIISCEKINIIKLNFARVQSVPNVRLLVLHYIIHNIT